jgi:hypothetical protein
MPKKFDESDAGFPILNNKLELKTWPTQVSFSLPLSYIYFGKVFG